MNLASTSIARDALDLPTVCVLCSHNCGAPRRRRGRRDRRDPRRRDEPDHQAATSATRLRHRPLRRARRARAAPAASAGRRHVRGSTGTTAIARDRRKRLNRIRAAALAARDRARRHRRAGQSHGRALRPRLPPRPRLAALVQRVRAGEDAAQAPRPVDVRRLAGDVPPRRHGALALPARARHEPEDLEPRPQRDRDVQDARRAGPAARWSSSIRARRRRRARRRATFACAPAPTRTSCSAWRPRSSRRSSTTARSCADRTHGLRRAPRRARGGRRRGDGAALRHHERRDRRRRRPASRRPKSAAIFYDLGVEQAPFSTLIAYLIRVLLVLTDNVGRPGGGVFLESFLPPVREPGRKREPERALASGIPAIARARQLRRCSRRRSSRRRSSSIIRSASARSSSRARTRCSRTPTRSAGARRASGSTFSSSIDPAMTETALHRRLRAADAGRLREVGVRELPAGLARDLRAGAPAGGDRVRRMRCPSRRSTRGSRRRWASSGEVPAELHELAKGALEPEGAMAFLGTSAGARCDRRRPTRCEGAADLLGVSRARAASARAVARGDLASVRT